MGYQDLVVYQQAVIINDLNVIFIERYIPKTSRTHDQMTQAGRSGKQNIVEGSLERSLKMNIKLTGVARGSYGELLEDYLDYLRQHNLPIWDIRDPRVIEIRASHMTYKSNESYKSYLESPEYHANLMVVLLHKENYLLDQLIRALENKFVTEGGYSENLFKKRLDSRYKS